MKHVCCLVAKSCLTLLWPAWTTACQAPLSMGFPRQEYWSGLLFPTSGCYFLLPDPGIEPASPALADRFFSTEPLEKSEVCTHYQKSLLCPCPFSGVSYSLPWFWFIQYILCVASAKSNHCGFPWIFLTTERIGKALFHLKVKGIICDINYASIK